MYIRRWGDTYKHAKYIREWLLACSRFWRPWKDKQNLIWKIYSRHEMREAEPNSLHVLSSLSKPECNPLISVSGSAWKPPRRHFIPLTARLHPRHLSLRATTHFSKFYNTFSRKPWPIPRFAWASKYICNTATEFRVDESPTRTFAFKELEKPRKTQNWRPLLTSLV